MKRKIFLFHIGYLLFLLTMGTVSCEKPILDDETGKVVPTEANVRPVATVTISKE